MLKIIQFVYCQLLSTKGVQKENNFVFLNTLFFFIRTSNFDAEAERSYIFWRFEAETFLKMFLNLPDKLVGSKVTALYENGWFTGTIEYYNAKLKEYKVNYLDNTSDFVSPDDFDGVEVILEQL